MAADTITNVAALFPKGFRHGVGSAAQTNMQTTLDSLRRNYCEAITVDSATVPKTINADSTFVTVTSADASYALALPAIDTDRLGEPIKILTDTSTGNELWATGSSIKINDVTCSATNEAALPADSLCVCTPVSSTEWLLEVTSKLGATVTAIVPDAR